MKIKTKNEVVGVVMEDMLREWKRVGERLKELWMLGFLYLCKTIITLILVEQS